MSDKIFRYKVVVETVDRPLKEMRDQLKAVTQAFKDQQDMMLKNVGAMGKLANTYKKFEIGKLAISGITSAMSGVFGIIGKGMDLMKDFGSTAVEAMQFRERAVFSLGRAFGDGAGKLQELIDLANTTTLDTGPIVEMSNALATSFKHFSDVKKIVTLAGDVLYQFPNLGEQFTTAFQNAGSGSMVESGSELKKAMLGGYNGYKRELAAQLGMKGKDLDNLTKVDELIKRAKANGKLTARVLTRGLAESLRKGLKEENIGDLTTAAAQKSLVGAVSNLRSALDSLLLSVHWEDYAGTGELAKFFNNITASLNTKEVRDAIGNAFNNIFAPLKDINESGAIQKFFTTTLPPLIDTIGAKMKDAFGWLTNLLTGKVSVGETFRRGLVGVLTSMKDLFIYIGELIGKGLIYTFKGGESREEKIAKMRKEVTYLEAPVSEHFKGTSFIAERAARLEKVREELYRMENMLSQEEFDKEKQAKKLKEKQIEDARLELVANNLKKDLTSVKDRVVNLYFDLSNVKKEDAEHIANKVAEKVKETRTASPSSMKRRKGK